MAKAAPKTVTKKSTVAPKSPARITKALVKTSLKITSKPAKGLTAAERNRFTLYGFAGSGPTYIVALAMSLMRHPFSYIHVSLRDGQHKQPDYIVKNRYGQVPALRDGQGYHVQSSAILIHLAEALSKFDGKSVAERSRIHEWMFWQWDKLATPIFRLRARNRGVRQFGEEVRSMYDTEAKSALSVVDAELSKSDWIAGKKPTIADISIYGVVRLVGEANIDLAPFPRVTAWKKRMEELPGFELPEQLLPMESRLI